MKINNVQNYQMHSRYGKTSVTTDSIRFRGTEATASQEEDSKKSGFSFKKATNLLGVIAWLTVAAVGVYKTGFLQSKHPDNIARKAKQGADKAGNLALTKMDGDKSKIDELFKGHGFAKMFYKMGNWSNNMKKRWGSELYNNITYAFGTLCVMPAVIWFSPFGKKDSSTSDKAYATLRQPFSVLATFTLQSMFDKLFDKYTPRVIKSNLIESEAVRKAAESNKNNAGVIPMAEFDNIKYNLDRALEIFEKELPKEGSLKGILTTDQAKQLIDLGPGADKEAEVYDERITKLEKMVTDPKAYDEYFGKIDEANSDPALLKRHAKEKALVERLKELTEEEMKVVKDKYSRITKVAGNNQLAKQTPKVLNNIVVSAVIGCTFLNVIYGKTMKAAENRRAAKKANAQKEVQ